MLQTNASRCRGLAKHCLLLLMVLSLACCAPIKSDNFKKWQTVTVALGDGADKVATLVTEQPRERAVQQLVNDPVQSLTFRLNRDDKAPFVWKATGSTPLFLHADRFAAGIRSLNSSLNEYSQALCDLSSDTLVDTAKLDQMAKDINSNARAAAIAFGADKTPDDQIALFTTIARGAAEAYLRNRQRTELIRVMEEAQPRIKRLSELGIDAIAAVTDTLWGEYDDRSKAIAERLKATGDARRTAAEELVELDRQHVLLLHNLQLLDDVYRKLPDAHQKLTDDLKGLDVDLASISQIIEKGIALRQLYEDLKNAKMPTTAPAK